MKREDVIKKLCVLCTKVGESEHFDNKYAHDCFCGEKEAFQFDRKILDFITDAIDEKLGHKEVEKEYQLMILIKQGKVLPAIDLCKELKGWDHSRACTYVYSLMR